MSNDVITIIVLGVFAVFGTAAVILIPRTQLARIKPVPDNLEYHKLENELRRTVIQVVGGLGVLIGLYFTWRTLSFNEFARNGERFTSLVANLNSDQPALRYDAIYELEAIGDASPARQTEVADFLCYWVREESKKPTKDSSTRAIEFAAVLKRVLGTDEHFSTTDPRPDAIDLSNADLSNITFQSVNFSNVNLSNANLSHSDFTYADLRKADLSGANLENAKLAYCKTSEVKIVTAGNLHQCSLQGDDLRGIDFSNMTLDDVTFFGCQLNGAKFCKATVMASSLYGADLSGVDLSGANLANATMITRSQLNKAHTNASTALPTSFAPEAPANTN